MSPQDPTPLDPLLERLSLAGALDDADGAPSNADADANPDHAQARAQARRLGLALAAATGQAGEHLSLDQLESLVRARRDAAPGAWEMPLHVSACPLCLEAFEVLLEGVPLAERATLDRFAAIAPGPIPLQQPARRRLTLAWRVGIAAAAILSAGVIWLAAQQFLGAGELITGSIAVGNHNSADNHADELAKGATLPQGTVLEALEETVAGLPDGSKLTIDAQSRLAVQRSLKGDVTVDLQFGRITAAVAKQTAGRTFRVITPLGQVTVVGTRFSVTSRSEPVTVFENGGENREPSQTQSRIKAVLVEVHEGVVMVKNTRDEVRLTAGQKAVLRGEPPSIEVTER